VWSGLYLKLPSLLECGVNFFCTSKPQIMSRICKDYCRSGIRSYWCIYRISQTFCSVILTVFSGERVTGYLVETTGAVKTVTVSVAISAQSFAIL